MIRQRSAAAAAMFVLVAGQLSAVELLTDGAFEFATAVPGWELVESIDDQGTMLPRDFGNVNSAQQQGFGPLSGELALWLRAFAGRQAPGPDAVTNASLSQTVPAVAGEEFSFSGWSRWEINYSGGANTLVSNGPLGAIPSPTETTMELAFLDASGSVIGSPTTLDLRTQQNNFNVWVQHTLVDAAPAGTASVRVSADAEQMVWNGGGQESAFYDSFSLAAASDPETELLANPDLEEVLPFFDPAWTIAEVPGGNIPSDPTISTIDFSNRADSGGQLGVWLRSFTGNADQPADAMLSQTVPGVPGGDYAFSAWSNFQANYSGGDPSFNTQTIMELAFLDAGGTEIGTPLLLDLYADGQRNNGEWMQHMIDGTAPAGTESVRVTAAGLDMQTNPAGGQQSAFLDDFSLDGPAVSEVDGDFNDDGIWDCADIDALTVAIASGSTALSFDMNGDGTINLADVADEIVGWLSVGGANNPAATGGAPFLPGDANLSGAVDVSDFNVWNGSKFTAVDGWCLGDFNADGSADVSDFNIWNGSKFTNSAGVAAVPEPGTTALLTTFLLALGVLPANRHQSP